MSYSSNRGFFTSKLEKWVKALHLLKMGQFKVLLPYFISSHSIKALTISFNKSAYKEKQRLNIVSQMCQFRTYSNFYVPQTCNNKACTWVNSASLGCHEHQHGSCHPSIEIGWHDDARKLKQCEALNIWQSSHPSKQKAKHRTIKNIFKEFQKGIHSLQGNLLPLYEGIHHPLFEPSRGTY